MADDALETLLVTHACQFSSAVRASSDVATDSNRRLDAALWRIDLLDRLAQAKRALRSGADAEQDMLAF